MRRAQHRKFLKDVAITVTIVLSLLGGFNLVIDEYGVFNVVHSAKLDRARGSRGSRMAKAQQISRRAWDVILLGNSRVEAGVDPAHKAWGASRVFNCGLSGLGFIEQARILDSVVRLAAHKTVVLCIDFSHFQDKAPVSEEFAHSLFDPDRFAISRHMEALWGINPTSDSYRTYMRYRSHRERDYTDLGLRTKAMAPPGRTGREAFEAYVTNGVESWRRQIPWPGDVQCQAALERLLQSAQDHSTRLIIVIMPVHSLDLEMCRSQLGSAAPIENWKRMLVETVAAFGRTNPGAPEIPLWDFTGYRGLNAEPVPALAEVRAMRWYWEPSHFRRELGDLLIERINGGTSPAEFGALIDVRGIEAHLARQRADREVFARDAAGEIAVIENAVRASR